MWYMVVQALTYEADRQCPYRWIKINMNKPPWFTSEMSEIARDRDILFRNYRRGKKKNFDLYQKAVTKRKEFNKLVKVSRDSFYKEQVTIHKDDQVKFWKILGDIIGSKSSQQIGKVFEYGTNTLCDEESSVNRINEFFAAVGENIMEGLPTVEYKQMDPPNDCSKNEFALMTVVKFLEIVDELNYSKSSGVDNLNSRLIIDAMKGIPNVFVKI